MFDEHLPTGLRGRDDVPENRADRRRRRRLGLRRPRVPEHRVECRRRSSSRRVRHGPDLVRGDAQGLLGRRRAGRRHERQWCARVDVLPVVPPPVRTGLPGGGRQGPRRGARACLQRLARPLVVRAAPRPLHPPRSPPVLGRRPDPRRAAAPRRDRASTRSRSPRTRRSSACPACTPSTGTCSGRHARTSRSCRVSTSVRRRRSP